MIAIIVIVIVTFLHAYSVREAAKRPPQRLAFTECTSPLLTVLAQHRLEMQQYAHDGSCINTLGACEREGLLGASLEGIPDPLPAEKGVGRRAEVSQLLASVHCEILRESFNTLNRYADVFLTHLPRSGGAAAAAAGRIDAAAPPPLQTAFVAVFIAAAHPPNRKVVLQTLILLLWLNQSLSAASTGSSCVLSQSGLLMRPRG